MTTNRFIGHALVALFALSVISPASAEEAPASEEKTERSSDEIIGDLPKEQQKAVEKAIEQAETPEGTTVIVVPPPEAKMREYDPS